MGIVYRAEDIRLKRIVALKFLPVELSRSADELARFQQEAQAISALNHPGIATLYDIGEADGRRFLALEYIAGGTLRTHLARLRDEGKMMPIEEAVALLAQAAEALEHAHRAGIVHRDIKSDNIMLTADGRVKVTDFGLAKLRGAGTLTQAGSTVGTLAYMAPEQMRGEEVDARADLFSLGVVAYELLTGRLPFRGEHEAAIMYSVLHEEPEPLEHHRGDVPAALRTVIDRALSKAPARRFASAAAIAADLHRPASSTTLAPTAAVTTTEESPSIVVLPFQNMSPDADNEYFADGLTEETISDLSKVRSLRVISRTSAMLLKGSGKGPRAIAQELDVRYVLEGSVRKAGTSLRITAQLIDGRTDANLWSEKYSGTLDDVFEIQEKVSHAIVDALRVTLSTEERRGIAERPIADARAHDLYLRARQEFHRGAPEALARSISLLHQGLEIVGENELLYSALGQTHYAHWRWISRTGEAHLEKAKECAHKVFALNPSSAHGFTLQGLLLSAEGDMPGALRTLARAIAIDPSNTPALLWISSFSSWVGDHARAVRAADALVAIDPLTPINTFIRGVIDVYNGEIDAAMPWIERAFAMDAESPLALWSYTIALAWAKRGAKIAPWVDKLAAQAPGWVYTQQALFLRHALRGQREEALRYDTEELALEAHHDCHFSLHVAHCFALIGEKERALDHLERSIRMGMYNHRFLSAADPLLESLRGEPRFASLMREAKERQQHVTE